MSRGPTLDAVQLLLEVDDVFGPEGVCPSSCEFGHDRLVVITGDNASGKSFFARHLKVGLEQDGEKVEFIPVSMSMRTSPGMHRVFMFGDEGWDATGNISIRSILGAIRTCRGREGKHFLLLDEPDIGLSEAFARALGEHLAQFAMDLPENTVGVAVVSHSRPLVRELMKAGPTSVRVGEDQRTLAEWLEHGPLPKSVEDLEELAKTANTRLRAIKAVMDSREDKSAPSPR